MERPQTQHARIRATVKRIGVLAGFLEGEGSFDRSGGSSRISAHQVNREPIDWLLDLFGGAAKRYHPKQSATHKSQPSPVWNWYVSGSRARGVMMTIYSLMSAKRKEQIRRALV